MSDNITEQGIYLAIAACIYCLVVLAIVVGAIVYEDFDLGEIFAGLCCGFILSLLWLGVLGFLICTIYSDWRSRGAPPSGGGVMVKVRDDGFVEGVVVGASLGGDYE